jgi:ATP-dependent Clp protease protease subunit
MQMKEINRRWFSVKADAAKAEAEISIFDEIGAWGVTVSDFKKELDAIKDAKAITLYLNSIGGDVFAAKAIYNLLAPLSEKITVRTLGIAASAAAAIALVGKTHIMAEGSYFMIHNAWTIAIGNAADLRKVAGLLDAVDQDAVIIYEAKSKKTTDEIKMMMAAETWLTAEEAVAMGFADSVEEAEQIAAIADLSKFNYQHTPKAVLDRIEKKNNPPATPRDLERVLRDAGYSRKIAAGIVADGFSAVSDAGRSEEEDLGTESAAPAAGEQNVIYLTPERLRVMRAKLRLLALVS